MDRPSGGSPPEGESAPAGTGATQITTTREQNSSAPACGQVFLHGVVCPCLPAAPEPPAHRRSGKWSDPGVPHTGWTCTGVEDLGPGASVVCEMCETTEIRYVHTMEHLEAETLEVGCVCAGHMEEDPEGARRRETALKNRDRRRVKWLSRKWTRTTKGNKTLKLGERRVTVFSHGGGYRFVVGDVRTNTFSQRTFTTFEEAALAAFDAMNGGGR